MRNNELIPLTNNGQAVSAKELYKFLGIKEQFTDWFNRMISYDLEQDIDYQAITVFLPHANGVGGVNSKDYVLTLDAAKEISMLQRSAKGKEARKYFIEIEKEYKKNSISTARRSREEILAEAHLVSLQIIEESKARIAEQDTVIKQLAPKAAYTDEVLNSKDIWSVGTIAKELNMRSAMALNRLLHKMGIQYKNSDGVWVLYAQYQGFGYTKTRTTTHVDSQGNLHTDISTKWTEKGRNFIHSVLKKSLANR